MLLTTLGVVFGVGMVFGVLLLSATMFKTFEELYDSVYGKTDLIVAGKSDVGTLPVSELKKVRAVEGVKYAEGSLFAVFTLVKKSGKAEKSQSGQLNVAGINPKGPDLTGGNTVAGRDVKKGAEIVVEKNWADSNHIKLGRSVKLATPSGVNNFRVVGLFEFGTGSNFGGQGFAWIPIGEARRVMDNRDSFTEIDIALVSPERLDTVSRELKKVLGKGVEVITPDAKTEQIQDQLKGFNVMLLFFAGTALFVGAFIIFNSFSMTMLQRMREIGMLRTLGAGRGMILRSVLLEALMLGIVGSLIGLGLGIGLALGLIAFIKAIGFPIGSLEVTTTALVAALIIGVLVTIFGAGYPAVRASRTLPIRAVLGMGQARTKPSGKRSVLGLVILATGLPGVYLLASSNSVPTPVAVAGVTGVIFVFLGVSLLAPALVGPISRAFSWPIRKVQPIEGKLAADSANANPNRTAATASALMISLALVTAFGALGSSFLRTISDEIDKSLARDFTVQPINFNPGGGPQQKVESKLQRKIQKLPQADVVTPIRFLFLEELPSGGGIALGFNPKTNADVDNTTIEGASEDEVYRRVGEGEVTVGEGLAKARNYKVGDRIKLSGASGTRTARIAGIIKTAIFGGITIGMSLETMKEIYGVTTDSTLAITAKSPEVRGELDRGIERVLKDYPQLEVLSNDEIKEGIEDRLNQMFSFFYAIMGAAIIISLFGIINTLSMNVLERTREIGIMRALGSSRWQIRRVIGLEGLLLSLVGALLGLIVGLLLGFVFVKGAAVAIPSIHYQPPWLTIAIVSIIALVLGLVASIIPARRAAKLNIIDAISYE